MNINYNVRKLDYRYRLRNLDVQAQSNLKSNKFFPVFLIDGKEKIFKPLSKTKPLTTPYFAYSEVVWSTILHDFFDSTTPIYELAIIENIEDDFENKYHHGVLVDNIKCKNEKLINLYEYFRDNSESVFDIKDYINYALEFYNYTNVFETEFMKKNAKIAEKFAYQLLLSILKCDLNYHYENPLFKSTEEKIFDVASMIDHEFSAMFLFVENDLLHNIRFGKAINSLLFSKVDLSNYPIEQQRFLGSISNNLNVILQKYPNVSRYFFKKLSIFLDYIKNNPIVLEDKGYLVPFNSFNYKIGEQLYKEHNLEEAERLRKEEITEQFTPDISEVSNIMNKEINIFGSLLHNEMVRRLEK